MVVYECVKGNLLKYFKKVLKQKRYMFFILELVMVAIMPITMVIMTINEILHNRTIKKIKQEEWEPDLDKGITQIFDK
jgi:hypothetical protein